MTVLPQLLQAKIVAIIRGVRPDAVLPVAEALYRGGIRALELTLNSERALEVLRALSDRMGDRLLVGAGTVLDAAAASDALDAGAQFIIAPSVDAETIRLTRERGAVSIPGAYTPTEILTAWRAGADLIKVFPASSPQYLRDLAGPLGHIPMMPTGGVTLENIGAFRQAGAVAFGVGSALVDTKKEMTSEALDDLTRKAARFVAAVHPEGTPAEHS
ncbi:MAG TPA: bifunctional 4-hydroxy-2-oxoglutarate aldolase/2-dehydro-3-deoxy-phosphogluconate aldolase [Chitinophagaceae bacterium]|jgi:2-dehydro-3-deoxyphosphogluconate aldolase/(4S)-4-hydroxy-2-oxoglutarate aldolase|nr:bifunctional 4-hydroxy-2-oxoglutarate aldolase/2-dehydro-3-deoxy-phosphogluconate aldolase [Chitinophagaceae bacterium]